MGSLVGALAKRTGLPAPELLSMFGHHLCKRFVLKFPHFFEAKGTLFEFLDSVDNHIHVEVHKLYPDAELPKFVLIARDDHSIDLDYSSCRPLESLAEGMINAAADHYGEPVAIDKSRIENESGSFTRFSIKHVACRQAA